VVEVDDGEHPLQQTQKKSMAQQAEKMRKKTMMILKQNLTNL
jgi:ABC-type transport system involved in cytochrome bd biosynthesis fused ATPase/permease subunit